MTRPLHDEFDVDEVAFRRQQKAQARRAPLKARPETVGEMAVTYNLTTDAANLLLAEHGFPPRLRAFLDAVVGVCGERVGEWFPASDEVLASRADKSVKTISRWREEYEAWMMSSRLALVDLKSHRYKQGEVPQPHEYRVNFSLQVAETLLEAEKRPEWKRNKGQALEASASDVKTSNLLPANTTNDKRTRRPRGDAEALMARKLRTAKTLVQKSLDIYKATGKHARIDRDAFAELERMMTELRSVVEAQAGEEILSSNYKEELLDKNDPADETPDPPVSGRVASPEDAPEVPEGGSGHFVYNPPLDADGSTTWGKISGDFDVSAYAYIDSDGSVVQRLPPPNKSSPAFEEAIFAEARRLEAQLRRAGGAP